MPPKTNKAQPQHQVDLKEDHVLQSVLLADPFGSEISWGPLVRQEDGPSSSSTIPWVRASTLLNSIPH